MPRDILTKGLADLAKKHLPETAKLKYASGGAVIFEDIDDYTRYFFIGKTTTNMTGEYYLITILVHEPKAELQVDGRANILVRRGFLGLGRKIIIDGEGKLVEIARKLYDEGRLGELYSSGYEAIVIRMGIKSPYLEAGDKSIVLIGRSTILYSFNPSKQLGKLIRIGRKLFLEVLREVYRG